MKLLKEFFRINKRIVFVMLPAMTRTKVDERNHWYVSMSTKSTLALQRSYSNSCYDQKEIDERTFANFIIVCMSSESILQASMVP